MDESVSLHGRLSSVESSSQYNMTKDGSGDDPLSSDSKTESNSSSDSGTESNRSSDLTASTGLSAVIRVLSDYMLRTELAEMEMIKAGEAARWEAEKRRMEVELELTRIMLQTHLQATTPPLLVEEHDISPSPRKRKRSEVIEDESSNTREKSLALLGLLQLNLIFSNSLT
ncbi:Uncharacterized protein HA466_0231290 [Hirschfeldia incana]|nr:Uncharacterized protein HA466_0231290 [Hirschfeldia incana]